ncbi:MAG: hypothetical protein Q4F17_00945 [Eubacteriales bacterium]|nr:hypothetical protein [Eubacteriales bacterium]
MTQSIFSVLIYVILAAICMAIGDDFSRDSRDALMKSAKADSEGFSLR